jgi:aspartate aminotransferase
MTDYSQQATSYLSNRVQSISESPIRIMFDLAQELDEDLVRLEVGEPDFTTPAHIIDASHKAAHEGATHYTSNAGQVDLRRAIADKMESDNSVNVDAEDVVVTNGAMEALYLSLLAVVDPGEEVVIPTPGWPNYTSQTTLVGGKPVHVPLDPDNDFDLDADKVVNSMSSNTSAIILNTPCNPTGRVFERDAIRSIVTAAANHDAYVLADEVYEGFIYDGSPEGIASYVDHPEHIITINACSKKFAMTGWRLGWLAASSEIAEAAATLHQSTSSCASSISQEAALAAINGDQTAAQEMRDAFVERRDYVVDRVADIPSITCTQPQGAFYTLLDVGNLEGESFDIAKRLMYDYGVVTAPGSGFGEISENHLRISFANNLEQIGRGFDRIDEMARTELDINERTQ